MLSPTVAYKFNQMINKLITFYKSHFGLKNATFLEIKHADTMVAIVYKIVAPLKPPFILKICTRKEDYYHEYYFLDYFKDKLPVPRLIAHVAPKENSYGAILMTYLPGKLLSEDNNSTLAYQMGTLLAQIHLHRTDGYGDLIALPLTSNPSTHFTFKFEEGLAECAAHFPESLLTRCREHYYRQLDVLSHVDGPCIVHRDFRPGNILVDNDEIQGVIDWASGRAGFAEEDFCSLEHGNFFSTPNTKSLFLSGYANIRPIPNYEAIMPLLRLSKTIGMIGFMVKTGTWNTSHTQLYQYNYQVLECLLSN